MHGIWGQLNVEDGNASALRGECFRVCELFCVVTPRKLVWVLSMGSWVRNGGWVERSARERHSLYAMSAESVGCDMGNTNDQSCRAHTARLQYGDIR
jgi:hypothetical protein